MFCFCSETAPECSNYLAFDANLTSAKTNYGHKFI